MRFEKAVQAFWLPSSVGGWKSGSREPGGQRPGARECQQVSHPPPFPASSPSVINKYKRRRFQKTKNLLTGETEADPEMIKVNTSRAVEFWGCRPARSQPSSQTTGVVF